MSGMEPGTKARRSRRQFSEEFKTGAVRLVLDEGKTVGAVARQLDLTPSSLGKWVSQARADRTEGKTGLTMAEREPRCIDRSDRGCPCEGASGVTPGRSRLLPPRARLRALEVCLR